MTRGLRHAGLVALLSALALDSLSARRPPPGDQPYVAISSLFGRVPNFDPLVDPYPFFLVRSWVLRMTLGGVNTVVKTGGERSLDLPLDIQAMNFSGTIILSAIKVGGGGPFTYSVIPNQISFGPTAATSPAAAGAAAGRFAESVLSLGSGEASMRIPTASAVVRVSNQSSNIRFEDAGSFLIVVEARDRAWGTLLGTGHFVVSQVVISDTESTGSCPNVVSPSWKLGDPDPPGYRRPQVLGLQQYLRDLFILKRSDPEERSFQSGVGAGRTGWLMDIDKAHVSTSPPISPSESVVRLVNETRHLRSLVAVGPRCRITGNVVLNPGDPPGEIRISRTNSPTTNTDTIVLAGDAEAFGRFSDTDFWTLFGGRVVTLTAFK